MSRATRADRAREAANGHASGQGSGDPGLAADRSDQPGRRAPTWAIAALRLVLPLVVAVFVGVVFGLLSWHFWVILLFPVVLGAAIGWAFAFSAFAVGTAGQQTPRRVPMALLAVGVALGFTTEQTFEDHHQRRAFAESVFLARAAGSGLEVNEIERLREVSGTAFLARDADAELDAQIFDRLGLDGPLGRFVSRLEAGVRLGGPYVGGRGLELGLLGGILVFCLELGLALLIARRIARSAIAAAAWPTSGAPANERGDPGLDPPPGPG